MEHLADVLLLLTLWKFGGAYLDLHWYDFLRKLWHSNWFRLDIADIWYRVFNIKMWQNFIESFKWKTLSKQENRSNKL